MLINFSKLTDGVNPTHPEHLELGDRLEVGPAEHRVDALVDVLLDVELLGDLEGGLAMGLVAAIVEGEETAAEPGRRFLTRPCTSSPMTTAA